MQEQCCICLQDFQDEILVSSHQFLETFQNTQHIKYQLPCLCAGSIYHYQCLYTFISGRYYTCCCCYCREPIPYLDKHHIYFSQNNSNQNDVEETQILQTRYKRLTFKLLISSILYNILLIIHQYSIHLTFNGMIQILCMSMILFHIRLIFWLYLEETHHEVFNMNIFLNSITVLCLLFIQQSEFEKIFSFLFIFIYPIIIFLER
jgi:hypothetical protein